MMLGLKFFKLDLFFVLLVHEAVLMCSFPFVSQRKKSELEEKKG